MRPFGRGEHSEAVVLLADFARARAATSHRRRGSLRPPYTLTVVSGNEVAAASLATLRFAGERFGRVGIPVDALPEVVTCQRMLYGLARQIFLRDHPEQVKVPTGFKDMSRVRMAALREGSSTILLQADNDGGPLKIRGSYVEMAAEELQRVLASILSGHGVAHQEFDIAACGQFGRTLAPDDTLTYISSSGRSIEMDQESAARLKQAAKDSATARRLPPRPGVWVGSVAEIDTAQGKFRLAGFEGRSRHVLRCSTEAVFEQLRAALRFEEDGDICVVCLPAVPSSGRLAGDARHPADMVADVVIVDDEQKIGRYGALLDRLESFTALEYGWDPETERSVPVGGAAKNVARSVISRVLTSELPLPYAYPIPDGSISLEWGLDEIGLNAEISNTADTVALMSWRRGGSDARSTAETVDSGDIERIAAWLSARLN